MRSTLLTNVFFAAFFSFTAAVGGQQPHQSPEHPKGNTATQMQALPLYNEACELYANGRVKQAKRALYEAINISFALTEAQLFLGKIFYDEGQLDSAFLYYHSGIDFVIEQQPYHYFYLFESGMRTGQYSFVKHDLGHFKKLYGKHHEGPYHADHSFTRDDFEFYDACISIIYDYRKWLPTAAVKDTLHNFDEVASTPNFLLVRADDTWQRLKSKKGKWKIGKDKTMPKGVRQAFFAPSGQLVFFVKEKEDASHAIYVAKREGKGWGQAREVEGVNVGNWNADPFYLEERGLLYWSSNRTGNKDIYVGKFDAASGRVSHTESLKYSNSARDDVSPWFDGDRFYCASNGIPGFGGFDVFETSTMITENGILLPGMVHNSGASINTHKDETGYRSDHFGFFTIKRSDFKGRSDLIRMVKLKTEDDFFFEISKKVLPQED